MNQRTTQQATQQTVSSGDVIQNLAINLHKKGALTQLKSCLPSGITPEYFLRVLFNALTFSKQKDAIAMCDPDTILVEATKAAADGLMLDSEEAVMLFRKNNKKSKAWGREVYDASYQRMYQGVLQLCRNSGLVKNVKAEIIHKGDVEQNRFSWVPSEMDEPYFNPDIFEMEAPRGVPVGAYGVIELINGGKYVCVYNKAKILEHAKQGHNEDNYLPQKNPLQFEGWWKKTVLLVAMKYAPKAKRARMISDRELLESQPSPTLYNQQQPRAYSLPPGAPTGALPVPEDEILDEMTGNIDMHTGELMPVENQSPQQVSHQGEAQQLQAAVTDDPGEGHTVAFNKILDALRECKTPADLDELNKLEHWSRLDDGEPKALRQIIEQRRTSLANAGKSE